MAKINLSLKRVEIDKSTKTILIATTIAAVMTAFALTGSKALMGQLAYQKRVIDAKAQALTQLEANKQAIAGLRSSYEVFEEAPESAIGTPDKNSKVVLDALPSKYDFPALATSVEALLKGHSIESLEGIDEELLYNAEDSPANISSTEGSSADATADATAESVPVDGEELTGGIVEIPFKMVVKTDFQGAQRLLNDLDRSIRPFHILGFEASGGQNEMEITLSIKTYYQPEKILEIPFKEVQ